MFKGVYEFAGIVCEIEHKYQYFQTMAKNYISKKNSQYSFSITEEDIKFERDKSNADIDNKEFPDFYLESLAIYRKFLDYAWKENVFLFHSSSFEINKNGFILTAPSGTGKSTHARFLKEIYGNRFNIINDDKPLIKYDGKNFWIYGTPWNGKHELDTNTSCVLKGIFVLHQDTENKIEKLNASESFNNLFKQSHKPSGKPATTSILQLLIKMSSEVPAYSFGCTNSIESTKVSSKIIEELIKNR